MTTTSATASRSDAVPPMEQTLERSSTTRPDTGGSPVGEAEGVVVAVCVLEGSMSATT